MALVVKDRVKETTTTTGTGTVALVGAETGYQTFTAIGDGNTTFYAIELPATDEWEVGIGTYTSSGTTLSRDTVLESSNSGSLVDFSSGAKNVYCTYPAEKSIYAGNLPSKIVITKRDTTTVDVLLVNGYLPVLNRSGTTINVSVN